MALTSLISSGCGDEFAPMQSQLDGCFYECNEGHGGLIDAYFLDLKYICLCKDGHKIVGERDPRRTYIWNEWDL